MRVSVLLRCAPATTSEKASATATSSASSGRGHAAAAAAAGISNTCAWRVLPMHAWMQRQRQNTDKRNPSCSLPSSPQFFGAKCGPQSILLLPSAELSLDKYSPVLSALNHQHGVVSLPYTKSGSSSEGVEEVAAAMHAAVKERRAVAQRLRGDCSASPDIVRRTQREIDALSDGFLTEYCHSVVDVLDKLGVEWVTCVAQAFGALVAAKLALLFPERVGSIVLLNTPLITPNVASYAKQLKELRLAAPDINVPEQLLEFTAQDLSPCSLASRGCSASADDDDDASSSSSSSSSSSTSSSKKKDSSSSSSVMLRHGGTSDQQLAAACLGEPCPSSLADSDVNAFMSFDQLALLRHPICYAMPNADKASVEQETASLHEEWFNVRRIAKIKSASSPSSSLVVEQQEVEENSKCAAEVADQIANWTKRYDADETIARRWSQAKAEMLKYVSSPSSGDASKKKAAAPAAQGGKKSKEGKGKKKAAKE